MTADVLFPTSAAEAASLYGDGADITVVGGGTILLPEIAAGRVTPTRALMLNRAGLDTLRVDGDRVVIGAMVPIAALVDAPDERSQGRAHLADREVRQSATVGGNLSAAGATDAQRGDLGAPLIALGARVRSTGSGGERIDPSRTSSRATVRAARARDRVRRFERRTGATASAAVTRTRIRLPRRRLRAPAARPARRRLRRRADGRALPRRRGRAATPATS